MREKSRNSAEQILFAKMPDNATDSTDQNLTSQSVVLIQRYRLAESEERMFFKILDSLELVQALKSAVESINNTRIALVSKWVETLQVAGKSKETSKRHYVYGLESEGCESCFVTLPISKDVKTYDDLAELVKEWGLYIAELNGWEEAKVVKAIAHDIRKSSDVEQRQPFRPESISLKPKNVVLKPKDMKNVNVLSPAEMEEARLEGLRMAEKVYKAKIAAKIAKQVK